MPPYAERDLSNMKLPPGCSSSNSSPISPDAGSKDPSSGYLNGHTSYLRCGRCGTDLCLTSQIISKGFTGRHGRAYLVSASTSAHGHSATTTYNIPPTLPNTHTHKVVPRQLVTGAHSVSDLSCAFCGYVLGWKYVDAEEESQMYKVGKFILETKKICAAASWDEQAGAEKIGVAPVHLDDDSNVEFDSQDEDECEDLFAGVWSRSLASKRRRARRLGREESR